MLYPRCFAKTLSTCLVTANKISESRFDFRNVESAFTKYKISNSDYLNDVYDIKKITGGSYFEDLHMKSIFLLDDNLPYKEISETLRFRKTYHVPDYYLREMDAKILKSNFITGRLLVEASKNHRAVGDRDGAAQLLKSVNNFDLNADVISEYVKVGLLNLALKLAFFMPDPKLERSLTKIYEAREKPEALGKVALGFYENGDISAANVILVEAWRCADNQTPGRSMLGMGDIVDAAQFKAYKALVPIEISMKMFNTALEHARKTSNFRLSFTERYLDRAILLHEAGENKSTLLTLLQAGLKEITDFQTAQEPRHITENTQEILLQFARTFAALGFVDEGINIIRKTNKEYRTRFAEFYLSQKNFCSKDQKYIISIGKTLKIHSMIPLIIGSSIACARHGDENSTIDLLEEGISQQGNLIDFRELQKIDQIAYDLGDRTIIEKSIRSYLQDCRYVAFISTMCIRRSYYVMKNTIY